MSSFLVDLWDSIFTPGPTPTILRATNLSFGALQLVLLALLVATASVHFVVLSVLSAGLWWAINWFARELAREGERARRDDGSDTEVEVTGREGEGEARRRGVVAEEPVSRSSASTEDEWEKVSGGK
ncbi:hypothetical protein E4U42_003575 [Claviceps africana]|uniref:Uncharacterized protein n=1 Tax=Claviceps africana TaxID=83212 RepID=A0A8K0J6U2_9HYPO|nr:hypothetical protein E4U42_003575 [Claviceps africana]